MSNDDLAEVTITNGVNERGVGFCTVVARNPRGTIMLMGQLTPTEVRQHAMAYLEAAEAAEQDAAVLRCVRKLELPDELAGAVIAELRDSR
jgi:hypothetical protein